MDKMGEFTCCFRYDKFSWLSEKFQLNSIVCYFTTKNTKITNEKKNDRPFALRVLRALRGSKLTT